MEWNYDISEAPHDSHVILTTSCGKVTRSYWVHEYCTKSGAVLGGGRWCFLSRGHEPIAWMHWPDPAQPIN